MAAIGDLIDDCCRALENAGLTFGHGMDGAWDEATALVLAVTGMPDDRSSLVCEVTEADADAIETLLARRINERIPLAYLLGRVWFAGHEFIIEPGVVIPRSPIGQLIEQHFQPWLLKAPERIVDLCAGSGCIGIAAALAFPDARVTLVELDPAAAGLARRNVALHGLEDRVEVRQGDLFDALPKNARFDLILTNPPYVDRVDMSSLPAEFRHEPSLGLDGGDDGLVIVERILKGARNHLTASGMLVCEVGMSAPALLRAHPDTPFVWPVFERGGEGVFLLQASEPAWR